MDESQKEEFAPIEKSKTGRKPRAKKTSEKPAPKKVVEKPKEKVVEVPLEKTIIRTQRKKLFPAIVNGRERMITVPTYETISKDQNISIVLPDNSPLPGLARQGLKEVSEDCKDC